MLLRQICFDPLKESESVNQLRQKAERFVVAGKSYESSNDILLLKIFLSRQTALYRFFSHICPFCATCRKVLANL